MSSQLIEFLRECWLNYGGVLVQCIDLSWCLVSNVRGIIATYHDCLVGCGRARWCWRFTSHPSQRREGWGTRAFGAGGGWKAWWCWRFRSHPSQRREGWGTRAFGAGEVGRLGGAGGLRPTLRNGAKDGAPGFLGLVRLEGLVVVAAYVPPFATARRMGHPGFWGWWRLEGLVVVAVYVPPFATARRMGHPGFWGWWRLEGLVVLAAYVPPFATARRMGHPGFWGDAHKQQIPPLRHSTRFTRSGAGRDDAFMSITQRQVIRGSAEIKTAWRLASTPRM
jgi:hypothetical protein